MIPIFDLLTNWPVTSLKELCSDGDASIQTGPFGSALHASDYIADGTPCIMPQDIRDGRLVVENVARISDDDHKRLSRYQLRVGDIIYPRRGDISKRALIGKREAGWICGTGCLRIRPNQTKVSPDYLAFYLSHSAICEWLEGNAVGATMPHLNTGLIGSISVTLPPSSEQREIAAILGALDDKIELNRKTAATLEEMARTLYV
jgi:type I restriction enzyme S subunit